MDLSDRELKLTAIVYCKHGAEKHLKETGRLPDRIGGLWSVIPMRLAIEERGTDPVLSPDEQAVLDAILRENRLPGGCVRLVEPDPKAKGSPRKSSPSNSKMARPSDGCAMPSSTGSSVPTISIEQFIARIERLPETKLRPRSPKVWYSSEKEHWLGWLKQYGEPGPYGRKQAGRDAKFAYNHIVNPQMLLWLIRAAGFSTRKVSEAKRAAEVGTTLMQKAGAVRKLVPWADVASALWPDERIA